MYLSKSRKRTIILVFVFMLIAAGVAAFLVLQKPKLESASISGSGYTGSDLVAGVLPISATASYQWKVSDSPAGTFVEVPGATAATLKLSIADEGKYFMVTVKGTDKYTGKQDSPVFGPVKGVTVTWPQTTPITYGQSIADSGLGDGVALINGIQVSGTFSFTDTSIVPDKAGIYKADVIFTPNDLTKYKTITAKVNVTVNKALLTVTVKNVNVTYGDFAPTYEYTITGYVLGDDITKISGVPAINSLYTPGLSVSYSPIQIIGEIGTLNSNNYDFSFVFGELIINKKVLTIGGITGRNKVYDGTTAASASGKAVLIGVFPGDNVYLGGYPSFTFVQKLAGDNIKIIVRGYTIKGTKASNYTVVMPTLYADILPLVIP